MGRGQHPASPAWEPLWIHAADCGTPSLSLCRAPSNRVKGMPFRPVKAVAVDLFPQTPHCEMLILFERVEHIDGSGAVELQDPPSPPPPEPLGDILQETGASPPS